MALLAGPAFAQSDREMSAEDCAGLSTHFAQMAEALGGSGVAVFEAVDGWCVATDVSFGPDETGKFFVDRAEIRVDDAARLLAENVPPPAISLKVSGFYFGVALDVDPVMTYLLQRQAAAGAMDITLETRWDATTRVFDVTEFSAMSSALNRIAVSARISGVYLSGMGALQTSVGGAAVNSLEIVFTTHGFFEGYFMMPLFGQLLSGAETPDVQMSTLKAQAVAALKTAPAEIITPASVAALAGLVYTLPNPAGTLRLGVESEAGIGAVRLAPVMITGVPTTMEEVWDILDGVKINAVWEAD
jgi:hypothetical protein